MSTGLLDAGLTTIHVDGLHPRSQRPRLANALASTHPTRFPSGFKAARDYLRAVAQLGASATSSAARRAAICLENASTRSIVSPRLPCSMMPSTSASERSTRSSRPAPRPSASGSGVREHSALPPPPVERLGAAPVHFADEAHGAAASGADRALTHAAQSLG